MKRDKYPLILSTVNGNGYSGYIKYSRPLDDLGSGLWRVIFTIHLGDEHYSLVIPGEYERNEADRILQRYCEASQRRQVPQFVLSPTLRRQLPAITTR